MRNEGEQKCGRTSREKAGFDLAQTNGVHVRAHISESGRGSLGSIERNVRVEITHDLLPDARPSTEKLF